MEEARGPMGLRKDLHIFELTQDPVIAARWESIKGTAPTQADVDAMFADFVPAQLECLRKYTTILPGVKDTLVKMQSEGIKIGASTGFVRSMVDILLEDSIKQGFTPDATVAGDEVIHGARPAPHMVWKNLDIMGISEIKSVVKCDDTVSGIGEALNAGCWGVGLVRYSNYMNINSLEEEATLSEAEIARRMAHTRKILEQSGAHYVIDSLVELPAVIDDINARLARGEKP
jgi:phosphonoacetaldehyde hydrolase